MGSTTIHVGLNEDGKAGSRISRPPGGASSNIFGGPDVDDAPRRVKNYQKSDIFGTDSVAANNNTAKPRNIGGPRGSSNIFGDAPDYGHKEDKPAAEESQQDEKAAAEEKPCEVATPTEEAPTKRADSATDTASTPEQEVESAAANDAAPPTDEAPPSDSAAVAECEATPAVAEPVAASPVDARQGAGDPPPPTSIVKQYANRMRGSWLQEDISILGNDQVSGEGDTTYHGRGLCSKHQASAAAAQRFTAPLVAGQQELW
ncbi:PREDICTED: hematological and neurological expressed 1-like protein [Priapulus caudatus]|uniref:Microtubule-associated protein Jupiter n=1 Tax=Priapulus caudatus TaxID=37621 RepID=A0ABM1EEL6_PRICU|nr:PREDICTED: hematological and neurological expressed 1-like protein [Priapulus caudatus]